MQQSVSTIEGPTMAPRLSKVLVIDDSIADRFIAQKILEKNHIADSIVLKPSGKEGLEYFISTIPLQQMPDLIFLDIRMPVMDGIEFLEKFKDLPEFAKKSCKIYMLSSSDYIEDKKRAGQYPFVQGFISKPLSEKTLMSNFTLI